MINRTAILELDAKNIDPQGDFDLLVFKTPTIEFTHCVSLRWPYNLLYFLIQARNTNSINWGSRFPYRIQYDNKVIKSSLHQSVNMKTDICVSYSETKIIS